MSRLSQTIKQVKANNKGKTAIRGETYKAFNHLLEVQGIHTCSRIELCGPRNAELRYSLVELILGGDVCLGSVQ